MKKKLKALVAMMSLCALGSVGSALALTRDAHTVTGNSAQFDQAIYLYWDSGSGSSATMSDISSIATNVPEYRYLTVAPRATKSVAGTVRVSFSLAPGEGTVITGLTIDVYQVNSLPANTKEAAAAAIEGLSRAAWLTPTRDNDSFDITISNSGNVAHEEISYYVIKVNYDGTAKSTLGGTVNISQSFIPAA